MGAARARAGGVDSREPLGVAAWVSMPAADLRAVEYRFIRSHQSTIKNHGFRYCCV